MKRYHLHRSDKQWNDHDEIEQLLASLRIMTVACCLENEPYLFTVDFVWEPQTRQLWFHCAPEGRKMDILQANPRVCVTVVEDRGYIPLTHPRGRSANGHRPRGEATRTRTPRPKA